MAALFGVKSTGVQEAGRLYDELIKKVFAKVTTPVNAIVRVSRWGPAHFHTL